MPRRIARISKPELSRVVSSRSRITAGGCDASSFFSSSAPVQARSASAASSCRFAAAYVCRADARYSAALCTHNVALTSACPALHGGATDCCGGGVVVVVLAEARRSERAKTVRFIEPPENENGHPLRVAVSFITSRLRLEGGAHAEAGLPARAVRGGDELAARLEGTAEALPVDWLSGGGVDTTVGHGIEVLVGDEAH